MLTRSLFGCQSLTLNVMIQVSQSVRLVNCVTKSLIHEIAFNLNLNRCLFSHCSHCSHCSHIRLWLLVGSKGPTDRQTMSLIELSWTARYMYFFIGPVSKTKMNFSAKIWVFEDSSLHLREGTPTKSEIFLTMNSSWNPLILFGGLEQLPSSFDCKLGYSLYFAVRQLALARTLFCKASTYFIRTYLCLLQCNCWVDRFL